MYKAEIEGSLRALTMIYTVTGSIAHRASM